MVGMQKKKQRPMATLIDCVGITGLDGGGLNKRSRGKRRFGIREEMSFRWRDWFVGDEIRGKKIKSERKPEDPFVVFETEVLLLLLQVSSPLV